MTTPAAGPSAQDGDPDWPALLEAVCAGIGVSSSYQPIVDVARAVTVGFEALARFDEPRHLGNERWFAAARRHGVHAEMEAAALRAALRGRESLPANTFLTVNVSPDVLVTEQIRSVWREHGDLGGLVVELTEQAPIESYRALEGDLAALRAAGALIAVDDAGAGYAGLRHLLALRPAIIKLDRELIVDVDVDEAKRALVEMVGMFADRIDAWLLAEGIERPGELEALARMGVPLVQGYYLAEPGPRWPSVNPDAVLRLQQYRGAPAALTVREVIELVPTAGNIAEAAAHFARDDTHTVVLVDSDVHPIAVYTPDMALVGAVDRGMRVNVNTPVTQALMRALTRDSPRRYEPVLCTDSAGRFLGVARIERMAHAALADQRPTRLGIPNVG